MSFNGDTRKFCLVEGGTNSVTSFVMCLSNLNVFIKRLGNGESNDQAQVLFEWQRKGNWRA